MSSLQLHLRLSSQIACEWDGIGPMHLETLQVGDGTQVLPLRTKPELHAVGKAAQHRLQSKRSDRLPKEHCELLQIWWLSAGIRPSHRDALQERDLTQNGPFLW